MSLRDEITLYTELSGNDGNHTPIGIIGAYLDGYEKGKVDAQPETKWIPVSERLPADVKMGEEYQKVIFCTKKATYFGFYDDMGGRWVCGYGRWDDYRVDNVIAWMPLPKPYREEGDFRNEDITIEPEYKQKSYTKADYIMCLHKEYGCTLANAEQAHEKALEYLRDKAMMKG